MMRKVKRLESGKKYRIFANDSIVEILYLCSVGDVSFIAAGPKMKLYKVKSADIQLVE